MVKKVKNIAGNNVSHVFDTIAGNDNEPGKVLTPLPPAGGTQVVRKDVRVTSPSSTSPRNHSSSWTAEKLSLSETVTNIFSSSTVSGTAT